MQLINHRKGLYKRKAKQSLYAGKYLTGIFNRSIRYNRY